MHSKTKTGMNLSQEVTRVPIQYSTQKVKGIVSQQWADVFARSFSATMQLFGSATEVDNVKMKNSIMMQCDQPNMNCRE